MADEQTERAQALCEYVDTVFDGESERYSAIEEKALRYLTLLGFLLGSANFVLIEPLSATLRLTGWSLAHQVFVVASVAATGFGLVAAGLTLATMRVSFVPFRPIDTSETPEKKRIVNLYMDHPLADTLTSYAEQAFAATADLRRKNTTRSHLLQAVFWTTAFALVSFAVTLWAFVEIAPTLPTK